MSGHHDTDGAEIHLRHEDIFALAAGHAAVPWSPTRVAGRLGGMGRGRRFCVARVFDKHDGATPWGGRGHQLDLGPANGVFRVGATNCSAPGLP